jgi:hypothetical protein
MKRHCDGATRDRASSYREHCLNLLLACASLLVFFLACELIVFRFVLRATDLPENAFAEGVIRYAPEQTGVFRVGDEIEAPYRINQDGWNSGISDYREERTPGIGRIAVIGDSYVEAFSVPFDASFAELTQRKTSGPGAARSESIASASAARRSASISMSCSAKRSIFGPIGSWSRSFTTTSPSRSSSNRADIPPLF